MALTNVSDMKDLLAKILLRDKQQPEKLIIDLVTPQSDKLDNVITPPLSQQFANIKIGQIHANQVQVRTVFSEKHIIELAKSMELNGILQPIIVRIHPNQAYHGETTHYQIVAGERRWRAAKLAKLEKIPSLILDLNDLQVAQIGLVENIQRQGLEPLEEAKAFETLIENYQHTASEIADSIGKTRTYVTNRIRLLSLPDEVQESLSNHEISSGHARAIIKTEEPVVLSKKIISKKLSVRQTEMMVNSIKEGAIETSINIDNQRVEGLLDRLRCVCPASKTTATNVKDGVTFNARFRSIEDFEKFICSLENNVEDIKL